MIRAIVYDAVGTLIHVKPSVAALYVEVARRHGGRLDEAEVRRRFSRAFARQEQIDRDRAWRTDEARERERWQDIVAEVLDDTSNPCACFEMLWHTFSKPDAWTVDTDAASVIAACRERGLMQAIASNFDGRLRGLIERMPELHGLAPIVVSSEVGWRKPAPEFFERLLHALDLPASDVLFVGDDRVNDFDAAKRAGMHAVLLDPAKKHVDGVERITRLNELITLAV
jgi:putative hydrolase of the HAD superfamily